MGTQLGPKGPCLLSLRLTSLVLFGELGLHTVFVSLCWSLRGQPGQDSPGVGGAVVSPNNEWGD